MTRCDANVFVLNTCRVIHLLKQLIDCVVQRLTINFLN